MLNYVVLSQCVIKTMKKSNDCLMFDGVVFSSLPDNLIVSIHVFGRKKEDTLEYTWIRSG